MFAALAGFFGFSSLVNAAGPPSKGLRVPNPVPEPSPEPPVPRPVTTRALEVTAKDTARTRIMEVTYRKGETGGLPSTRAEREEGARRAPKAPDVDSSKLLAALREAGLATTLAVREEGARK
jgi:hypothetical protein